MVSFSIMRSRFSFRMRPSASTLADVSTESAKYSAVSFRFSRIMLLAALSDSRRCSLWGGFLGALADERHELFRKPFRREAIFECIEVCALFAKRGHFGAECVHFGPQAIRHDEIFIEVVRFRINAFLYVAVHVRALSRVRLLGKVFLIQECHSRMCEGMNLCPIIAAGMSSCFPFLSVGGRVVKAASLLALPFVLAWDSGLCRCWVLLLSCAVTL